MAHHNDTTQTPPTPVMELGDGIPSALFRVMIDAALATHVSLPWLCSLYRAGYAQGRADQGAEHLAKLDALIASLRTRDG